MVRKANHSTLRPMSQYELIVKIESGDFEPQDEVCTSCGHWFSLREAPEIRNSLGDIRLDKLYAKKDEENTSTSFTEPNSNRTQILKQTGSINASHPAHLRATLLPKDLKMKHHVEIQTWIKRGIILLVLLSAALFGLITFWLRGY